MTAIEKIGDFTWKIEKEGDMNVPVIIYASKKLLEKIKGDKTIQQAKNVASLPKVIEKVVVCPDAHQGYGFPIGGVAAFPIEDGIITPGGIGFDINCGVRLLTTNIKVEDFEEKKKEIINKLFKKIPSGVGSGGELEVNKETMKEVLEKGSEWAVENGYGRKEDLERTEENGKMEAANSENVSEKAIKRGLSQLGTLGSGNHFLEIQRVDRILDEEVAQKFGIEKENICVMIHCGSRGLGHQVASDYMKEMENHYGHEGLEDRELINAPIRSDLGQKYLSAMNSAVNYAFANRQIIMEWTREVFKKVLPDSKLDLVYDVCHNVAKIEEHKVNKEKKKICVHRKGATRAFGPGREEVPQIYRDVGQPVLIPGSMGTSSYLLRGTKKAEDLSWGSTAHGAGRVMSRKQATREEHGGDVKDKLEKQGIALEAKSLKGVAEEAPYAYKDIDEVVKVSDELGIGQVVAKLKPLAVMKG